MKNSKVKIIWPNNIETFASEGEDWFSTAEKAGFEIPSGCLTGSCGACEIDVNGETIRACISNIESKKKSPLKTTFFEKKLTRQISSESLWPCQSKINGFEIHNGQTKLDSTQTSLNINQIFKDLNLGWYKENKDGGTIAGTYIHGIFENDKWRDQYINLIRERKKLPALEKKTRSYKIKRESIIENLANEFNKNLNLSSLLN